MVDKAGFKGDLQRLVELFRLRMPIVVLAEYFKVSAHVIHTQLKKARERNDVPVDLELLPASFLGLREAYRILIGSPQFQGEYLGDRTFHQVRTTLCSKLCDLADFSIPFWRSIFETSAALTPHQSLLLTIFGDPNNNWDSILESEIGKLLMSHELEYGIKEFSVELKASLFTQLRSGKWSWYLSKRDQMAIDAAVISVGGRDAEIIRLRFGLDIGQPMTLAQIGTKYGVTATTIRQKEARGMAKLRHPSRARVIKPLLEGGLVGRYDRLGEVHAELKTDHEALKVDLVETNRVLAETPYVKVLQANYDAKVSDIEWLEEEMARRRSRQLPDGEVRIKASLLDEDVDFLELSVRAYNGVKRMGLKTLGQLIQCTESDFFMTRNLGKETLKEINNLLEEKGLRIGMKVVRVPDDAESDLDDLPISVPVKTEVLDQPLESPYLGTQTCMFLTARGINTVGELAQCRVEDLLRARGFGEQSLVEVKELLSQHGLRLGMRIVRE